MTLKLGMQQVVFKTTLPCLQVKNLEMISAPAPKMLMQASVKQALRRLDNVDPEVKEFFMGAAKTVAEGADPVDALAAALGCMSGFTEVPKDRSLLTQVGFGSDRRLRNAWSFS